MNKNGVSIGKIVTEIEYDTDEKPTKIVCSEYDRADKLVDRKEIFPS